MRIAFTYGPFSIGQRSIDFANLWDDPRGLTGSEISCVEYARAMADRGHAVTLMCCQPAEQRLTMLAPQGATLRVEAGPSALVGVGGEAHARSVWDAVCAWNEPDVLRFVHPTAVRLVNQQLNDWSYCQPGFAEHVDLFTSPSRHHMHYVSHLEPPLAGSRWAVLSNGCDPTAYDRGPRTPGRVLWASSPDRGLHLLLAAWSEIRRRAPHATLDCYYNFPPSLIETYEEGSIGLNGLPVSADILELARRARYVRYALPRLAHLGVRHLGSVSRREISRAMAGATVLAYPCDTIRYTEGFSVTTMEACAAGLVPVISSVDALGEIYETLGREVVVPAPVAAHTAEFVDAVCDRIDGDPEVTGRGLALAGRHAWPVLAERLEWLIDRARSEKT